MPTGSTLHTNARLNLLRALRALDEGRAEAGINEAYLDARGALLEQIAVADCPWSSEERELLQAIVAHGAASWEQMAAQKAALAQRLQSLQQRRREACVAPPGWAARYQRTC